jgi:hypothetical protein
VKLREGESQLQCARGEWNPAGQALQFRNGAIGNIQSRYFRKEEQL